MLPALAGANMIYGMGMIEQGITFSFPQLVIDAEIIRMIQRILRGISVNKETLAVDVIKAVGPGGNYLGEIHTALNFRNEQSETELIDRTMRDVWKANGSTDIKERAQAKVMDIIKNHKPTPLSPDVAQGLKDIIAEAEEDYGIVSKEN